jgi:hypothetical protein
MSFPVANLPADTPNASPMPAVNPWLISFARPTLPMVATASSSPIATVNPSPMPLETQGCINSPHSLSSHDSSPIRTPTTILQLSSLQSLSSSRGFQGCIDSSTFAELARFELEAPVRRGLAASVVITYSCSDFQSFSGWFQVGQGYRHETIPLMDTRGIINRRDPKGYRHVTIPVMDARGTHRSSRSERIAVHGGTGLAARNDPSNGHRRDQPLVEIRTYRSAQCSRDSLIQRGTI